MTFVASIDAAIVPHCLLTMTFEAWIVAAIVPHCLCEKQRNTSSPTGTYKKVHGSTFWPNTSVPNLPTIRWQADSAHLSYRT